MGRRINMKHPKILTALFSSLAFMIIAFNHDQQSVQATDFNYPVATATQQPTTPLFNRQGHQLSKTVAAQTAWRVGDIQVINGQKMYLIGPNLWLPSASSINNFIPSQYAYHVARVVTPKKKVAALYDDQGQKIALQTVANFSDWKVGHIKTIQNQTYYQIAANEWLNAQDVYVNFATTNNMSPITVVTDNSQAHVTSTNNNSVAQQNFNANAVKDAMLQELNRLRSLNNLTSLQENTALTQFSMQRAQTLAASGQLDDHDGWYENVYPQNSYALMGENLDQNELQATPQQDAILATSDFFHEYYSTNDGHRKNMLSPFYTQVGIGVAIDSTGLMYTVQTFATPQADFDYTEVAAVNNYNNAPAPQGKYDH